MADVTSDIPVEAPKAEQENAESPELTKLESDIIHQIEYYFGDANLARDKFLLEQINQHEGSWVPLSVLLTFKRLANLTSDPKVIIAAMNKSNEGLVEVDEEKGIRRHPECPIPELNEEKRLEIQSRTAYVKGFPPVGTEMSDIIEFLNPYEKIVHIIMRKYHEKATKKYLFKGSCFVTFSKQEECASFVEKEKVEYKENELIRKYKTAYLEEKKAERIKEDQKRHKNKKEDTRDLVLPSGAVLFLEGFPKESGVTREDIKETMNDLAVAEVAFVEFNKGDEKGHVRFAEENDATKVFEKFNECKISIKENEVTGRVLEGDEEREFLRNAIENMKARRNNSNKNRHGKHGNRKRRHDGDNDLPNKRR